MVKEWRKDKHRSLEFGGLPSHMEKPQGPGRSCWLYTVEPGGWLSVYSWTRSQSYDMQINKEAVLANLSRSSLCGGDSLGPYTSWGWRESCRGHCLYTWSTFSLIWGRLSQPSEPHPEKALPLPWSWDLSLTC